MVQTIPTITAAEREQLRQLLHVAGVLNAGLDEIYERAMQITREPKNPDVGDVGDWTFEAVYSQEPYDVDRLLRNLDVEVEEG